MSTIGGSPQHGSHTDYHDPKVTVAWRRGRDGGVRNGGFWEYFKGKTRRIFWLTGSRCERTVRMTPKFLA